MNSRRRFVRNTSLVTAALLAAKPFDLLASVVSDFQQFSGSVNRLSLLHTSAPLQAASVIKKMKNGKASILVNTSSAEGGSQFDITVKEMGEDFQPVIIEKQGLRTGIIRVKKYNPGLYDRVNSLAESLKKEKGCHAVVCISELGYRTKTGSDDLSLAASSLEIDIIIGINKDNHSPRPVIASNKIRGEVIIHSSVTKNCPLGSIEISYDAMGRKNGVLVANAA